MGYLKKWPCHEFSHILSSEPVPVVSDLGISTLALSPKKAKQDPHHCFWHAADTPPLEGLLFWMFLACGWSAVVDMLHMLAYAQEVGWLITLLTTVRQGPRNLLPKALWRWCFERWEKRNGWASERLHLKNENHEVTVITNIFLSSRISKLTHSAGETQIVDLESHACQSKWMSMLQTCLNKSHKYQLCVS